MSSASAVPFEVVLRRDRAIVVAAIAGVTILCWVYLFAMARQMASMELGAAMEMARIRPWTPLDFALLLLMWVVMMVGMMLPGAAPMILLYAQVQRKAAASSRALAPTSLFAAGYLAMWGVFSVVATGAQWGLDRLALLSPMMVATSPALGGVLLVAAGLYQLTPWKDVCLRHCRAPAHFLSSHWRPGRAGALRMGAEHGAFCLGCCWVLMALLFVGGVMNLLWIAALAFFVLLEKAVPWGRAGGRFGGVVLIATGLAVGTGWLAV